MLSKMMSDRYFASNVSRRSFLLTTSLVCSGLASGCFGREGEETSLQLRVPDQSTKGIAASSANLRSDQISLIEDAVANDAATVHGYRPFETIEYVLYEGTYYRLQTEQTGTETVETPVLVVAPTDDSSEAVPLDEYDGHVIELIAPLTGRNGSQTRPLYPDMNGYGRLYPEPEYEYVTWEEKTYHLSIETRPQEQQVYPIQIEAVASSPETFETYLRENRLDNRLDPGDFSQRARDIFRQSIENEYQEEDPYSEAFQTVLEAVKDGLAIKASTVQWLVVYDDVLYSAKIERIVYEP